MSEEDDTRKEKELPNRYIIDINELGPLLERIETDVRKVREIIGQVGPRGPRVEDFGMMIIDE